MLTPNRNPKSALTHAATAALLTFVSCMAALMAATASASAPPVPINADVNVAKTSQQVLCTPTLVCDQYSLKAADPSSTGCEAAASVVSQLTGVPGVGCSFYQDLATNDTASCQHVVSALEPMTGLAFRCYIFNDYTTFYPYMCTVGASQSLGVSRLCGNVAQRALA